MYKILLSDDEQIVLDSLQVIIRQQYGDRCYVSTARSGREAITIAESWHPDLAVMDINMPGINGIDAIRTIREISPGTQFILLTAFDKFDYAKQAINLGVQEYLTKPFNRKRIVDAIDVALTRVDITRQKRSNELEMREKLENVREILETGFFYSFLFADDQQTETARYLNLLDIPSPSGLIMTLEFGERQEETQSQNRIGLNVRVTRDYHILRESIKMIAPCLVGPLILNRMAIFIPIEAELTSGPDGQVKDQAIQIFNRVQKEIRMELRIGVSQPIESVSQLHDAYQESLLTLQLTPAGEIYYYKDLLPELAVNQKGHEDWLESSFLQAVRQADAELSSHYFNQLIQTLETGDQFNLAKTQSKMIEWLVLAARQSDKPGSNPIAALDYTPLLTCQNLDELRLRALDKIRELSVQFSGMSGRPVGDLIMQAQKYISENFAGNISLESVAEEIALSPQYFSRLFSSRAGRTFIDYLTELRINKACQLLLEGKLSIKEICSAVGYTDPNYFSRIFKKIIGKTPSEFRS